MSTVLIGAGGHAKVVYDVASSQNITFDGFIDPKVDNFYALLKMSEDANYKSFIISLGAANLEHLYKRHELFLIFKNKGKKPINVVSRFSYVSPNVSLENGTFVSHHVTINAGAKIGQNVIINTGVIIEHDAVIEDGVHIAPGAIILGGAHVKEMSMVGSGAVVLPNQAVPSNSLVPSLNRYKNA